MLIHMSMLELENISNLSILSAMITPAVLILASSSLILATSQRLARVLDRTRQLNQELSEVSLGDNTSIQSIFRLLTMSLRRAQVLQASLTSLYLGLTAFIAVSFSIGIGDIVRSNEDWVPVVLGVAGVLLLFCSSLLLIYESRLAIRSTGVESRFILGLRQDYARLIPRNKRLQRFLPIIRKYHRKQSQM